MNCQELTQLLDDGDLRNVPPAKRRELDAHLAGCANCAAEWRVQERIAMTPTLWVPAGFVARCRRLVAAGATRLFVPRRVILYSTLLVLAAAAALLAWRYSNPQASPAAVAAVPVVAAPVHAPPQVQPASEPAPESLKPQAAPPPRTVFTVAVPPLQVEGNDAEGQALAMQFRDRVITLLQEVPNLALVNAPPGAGPAAEYEVRMKFAASSSATLYTRTVSLEVTTSAELAATEAAIAAEARMSPEDQQRSSMARRFADLRKRSNSMRSGALSSLLGIGAPTLAIIYDRMLPDRVEFSPARLVRDLRVTVFPLDESFEQEELATLRNPSLQQAQRMRSLGALLLYAERRGGFSHASPAVVRAGGEFALTAQFQVALQRPAIWDGLALTGNSELIPYLARGLDEIALTETRLQLVKILTDKFGDDPLAKATLAVAAKSNDQQTVRMAALRGSGGSGWREYVVATLANSALPDLQRLQPIADMAPGELGTLGTSPKTAMALDDQQLRDLGAIIIRIAPEQAAGEVARKALFAAGAMETPAALDMLLEVAESLSAEKSPRGMEGVAIMGIRHTATSLIGFRYAGYPKARAVIAKLASSSDPLERMNAEMQLRLMETKATLEKAHQEQQSAR